MRRFLLDMLKNIFSTALLFIFFLGQLPVAHAQTPTPEERSSCVRLFRHFQSTWTTFSTFFDHFNGFFQNACHKEDIYALQDRLEQLRTQIRRAAYRCENATFNHLKDLYTKTEMELQYVLKAFTTGKWNPPWADTFVCRDVLPDAACTVNHVESELQTTFVDQKLLSKEKFQEYLTEFRERYTERIPQYKDCREPVSDDLAQSFTRFGQTMHDIGEVLTFGAFSQEPGLALESAAIRQELARRERRKEHLEKDAPAEAQQDFWDRWIEDVRLNDVPPKKALEDILAAYRQNLPFFGGEVPLDEARKEVAREESRYQTEFSETALRGQYEILYGNSGDALTNEMVGNLQALELALDWMIATIPADLTPKVKAIQAKQCNG